MTGEPYAARIRDPDRADILLTLMSGEFPSLKARQLMRVLGRLGYRVARHAGTSHRWMVAEGRPRIRIAFHDRETVDPVLVRNILVKQAGLTAEQALELIHND
jgi:predicted RNA binding protein YcfA (HicA-like mRNA interferase family)